LNYKSHINFFSSSRSNEVCCEYSSPSSAEVKNAWSYTPLPTAPPWRGAQLKTEGQLCLYFTHTHFVVKICAKTRNLVFLYLAIGLSNFIWR